MAVSTYRDLDTTTRLGLRKPKQVNIVGTRNEIKYCGGHRQIFRLFNRESCQSVGTKAVFKCSQAQGFWLKVNRE